MLAAIWWSGFAALSLLTVYLLALRRRQTVLLARNETRDLNQSRSTSASRDLKLGD
jgi:hypothetical protein